MILRGALVTPVCLCGSIVSASAGAALAGGGVPGRSVVAGS